MRKNCRDFLQDNSDLRFYQTLYHCTHSGENQALKSLTECEKLLANVLEITSTEVERLQSTKLSRLNPSHLEQIGNKMEDHCYRFRDSQELLSTLQNRTDSSAIAKKAEQLAEALEETKGKHEQLIGDFEEIFEARLYGRLKKSAESTKPKGIQFKIHLTNSKPQIWRRLHVPAEATLGDLSELIEVAMDWGSFERHQFIIRDVVYSNGKFDCDENELTLEELNLRKQTKIAYVYNSLARWHITVEFEKRLAAPHDCLELVESVGVSPPNDCSGLEEYYKALKVLKNPRHKEYSTYSAMFGKLNPNKGHTIVI